jgi:ferredoxin
MRARLLIDRRACAGTGLCQAMAPELFELHPDGPARVREHLLRDPDRIQSAGLVAECCPTAAVILRIDPEAAAEQEDPVDREAQR